ncbi:NAD(P)/FAD-dependent oxidoreductase [Streptomyces olivaceus]|uniref:NAD(P)/FAD-dependent oxidoreductase n=1 Tax=Streptomyces olivaceus TaxID=47716 RepID=A0ABS7W8D0_STROV|nr:NAD(P)/FAD-dependent oxidoreductase [Streptomyces olivaceus]MBZ6100496.1 NAD(P)/FAD-dependent oxidoreductase [Streptomyces olivaceus]MBZ6118790.1 NAD(P)/FAD-dependent oxidoreductase [Streptomyces olivaceus]MBZ6154223.1 NAD(P)/FAD-dependent oxidoreductase [Streptomyces olivaceus]MBZ6300479.1 NAD(P)/FAD-dependent oxidoreductase [Streptomyces olivaceus]
MRTELVVVGAGPAGLAAALAADARGVRVTVVDAADGPGGQFYRQPAAELNARRPQALHHQWRTWERLRDGLAASGVRLLTGHHVWTVTGGPDSFTVHALLGPGQDEPATVQADAVLLATGSHEHVLPFPGWTLPGVVTAGGAQAMLKGGLVVPGRVAVVAGTGPLLLPVATGLAAAGTRVSALVESAGPRQVARHARALAGKLPEGAGHAARLLRHRVRPLARHTVVRAHGDDRLTGVTVAALDADGHVRRGTGRYLPCDTLAVGHGLLPQTDLAEGLGCHLDGPAVTVDAEQRTSAPGVWAAGEATGVGGAALALAEGHIAGRSAAARLRGTEPDPAGWAPAARTREALRTAAAALDAAFAPPAHWAAQVTDDTVVCRCEEVTAGAVREAADGLGAGDVRTVKLLTRAGMGWCQGRMCATAVAGLTGCHSDPPRRPLARPVPLGILAGTAPDRAAPDRTAPDRTAPDRTAPDRTAPDRPAPDRAVSGRPVSASDRSPSEQASTGGLSSDRPPHGRLSRDQNPPEAFEEGSP